MKIPSVEIKHPLVHMVHNGVSTTVWWEDDDDINYFDDCPYNYPRWSIGSFESRDKAITRLKEMSKNEGWEIIENNLMDNQEEKNEAKIKRSN